MAYEAQITRDSPTCIIYLVDQSASMSGPVGGQAEKKKADAVADIINKLLHTLCIKSGKADGIREYFEIGVIGYGKGASSILGGPLAGRKLVKIGEIAMNPIRVDIREKMIDDGAGGVLKQKLKFPVWFDPVAVGKTPMRQAFELARQYLTDFLGRYPKSFPPLVFNLTDGAPDDDPNAAAEAVRALSTSDGNVLLFNLHISSREGTAIMFPDSESVLPSDLAKQLFRMSSVLPDRFVDIARAEDFPVTSASRGFAFNCDFVSVFRFLDIGTQSAQQVR